MIKRESNISGGHETKFILANSAAHVIIQWLMFRCLPDPYYPCGIVSSIYYDTPDWYFLREKINGDFFKAKVRARWYADLATGEPENDSFVEAKYKIGSQRRKIRVKTGHSGKWLSQVSLENQKLFNIPFLLRNKGVIIPGPTFPVFRIRFKRRRFVEPLSGNRLCVDYDICAPAVNFQMVPRTNPFQLTNAVFEVKGRLEELPDVLGQLTALGCRKESFSKFFACYNKIMRTTI